jgi:hypothetical protein
MFMPLKPFILAASTAVSLASAPAAAQDRLSLANSFRNELEIALAQKQPAKTAAQALNGEKQKPVTGEQIANKEVPGFKTVQSWIKKVTTIELY